MKFCNNCAVPESNKCDAVSCPPACNGAEDACPCFNTGCFKAGNESVFLSREGPCQSLTDQHSDDLTKPYKYKL